MPRTKFGTAKNISTWKHGTTTNIRVPVALKRKIMSIARAMDEVGFNPTIMDAQTYDLIVSILEESLHLPSNKGGAIKEKIREVLQIIQK